MTNILVGLIIGVIGGAFLGGGLVKMFNVTDTEINGKYKAKKDGKIDLTNILKPEKERKRIFNRKNK